MPTSVHWAHNVPGHSFPSSLISKSKILSGGSFRLGVQWASFLCLWVEYAWMFISWVMDVLEGFKRWNAKDHVRWYEMDKKEKTHQFRRSLTLWGKWSLGGFYVRNCIVWIMARLDIIRSINIVSGVVNIFQEPRGGTQIGFPHSCRHGRWSWASCQMGEGRRGKP